MVIASSKGNGYNDSIPFIRHNVQYRPIIKIADRITIRTEDSKSVQKCPNCGSLLFKSGYMSRYGCRNYKRNQKCSWRHWDNKTVGTPKHNETFVKLIAWMFIIIFGLAIMVGSCSNKQPHKTLPVNVIDTTSKVDTSFGSKVIKLLNVKYSEIKKNKANVWVGKRKDTGKWESIKSLNPKTRTKKHRREL